MSPVAGTGRGADSRPARGGERLKLENLESRQLMAADVSMVSADTLGPVDSRVELTSFIASNARSSLTTETAAEGEPAADLVQFAKDLTAAGVTFFGAGWCPACTEQKQIFQDGAHYLPFVEVTNPDRSLSQLGIDNNITAYPTWVFPDDTRQTGVMTLQQLSDRSGVAIPQSEDPTFVEIGDQTVLIGSPLHIPVDAYDANGGPLTVTVSVSDSNLLDASVVMGNRSIRIDMETYGDMVFELFEQRAPNATGRVIALAEDDFYNDIIFHRVIDDFVIQGGDPTGTGTGGSTLGDFDDDFHPELQHNRRGVLSFAKSSDDTNDSQFFVTEVPTRFLDYNHSVFGQLIEGDDVLEAISEHAVNSSDRPTTDIKIKTIDVFTDNENSLVMLKPTGNGVGSTDVTITVTDSDGNSHSETFQVDVNNDTANSQPYLNAVDVPDRFTPGAAATLQLASTDIEGDAVTYSAQVVSSSTGATATINQSGLLTVTPAAGYTGPVDVTVTVRPGTGVTGNGSSDSDSQRLRFNFEAEQTASAPTSVDLRTSSDTGSSGTDNITNAGTLAFTVDGVTAGATVQLINVQTNAVLGEAVASGSSVTVTTNNIAALGDGVYNISARQIVNSQTSAQSPSIAVTYDKTTPTSVASSANTRANVGRLYQSDLINSEEGSIKYALTNFPVGATINSGSGLIQWTPDSGDLGDNSFTVTTTDLAGNVRTETFNVNVAEAPKAEIQLVIKDTDGNVVTNLNTGDDFILELVGVDSRGSFDRDGVYAIYTDILFDSTIVRPKTGTTIEYVGDFTLAPKGSFTTGLIDEIGAASSRTTASNQSQSVIARVQMTAIGSGSVNIRSEEADEASSEVLLFGDDDQVSAESVFFGSVNLTVGADFTLTNDSVSVAEDSGATTIDVLANDTTNSASSLSVVSVTQPASGGTVSVSSGVVSFTPEADFNGTTTFTYRAGDGTGAQETATVTVTVTPVNDPPTGVADTLNVAENSTGNRLDVLANDSTSPDTGETLKVTAVGNSANGASITITTDGSAVNYTPVPGFTGIDTFTYTLSDGQSTTTASVTVTVTPSDAPPTAVDDAFTVNEDTAEASYDILQNDTRDTDNQSFVIDGVGGPSNGGNVRLSSDGETFFYEPAEDFFGTETVTYTIRDTGGGLSFGTVTFTVTAINDPPPVSNSTVQLSRGSGQTVILNLDDLPDNVDGDGETLTISVNGNSAAGGATTVDANGNLRYTPPSSSFVGTDTVSYTVADGSGTNSTGTITIQINEYTERNITVNFSGNQNRSIAAELKLTGTDVLGNDVSLNLVVDDSTNGFVANVLPGNYVIEIPALPFFTGGEAAQQYTVNSAPGDGDVTIEATMGRLKPEYLSIQDWLGSTPQQSVLVAIEPGQSALLTESSSQASASIVDPVVSLNAAGTQLTIAGKDDADAGISGSILTSRGDVVLPRGKFGDLQLYRVDVSDTAINYTADSSSSASTAAEGESVEAEDAVSGLSAAGSGEGEAVAAATSVSDVAAPLLSSAVLANTPSDASDQDPVEETVAETNADPISPQQLFSRFLSSTAASSSTDTGTTGDGQTANESSSSDASDDSESSGLSPSRVDRFFSRGR
ncbi:tandem-95 repeat protein [Stieleria sp. TO1_6]|nr:tandem-95 repeat protein [Stieleria tagensis]